MKSAFSRLCNKRGWGGVEYAVVRVFVCVCVWGGGGGLKSDKRGWMGGGGISGGRGWGEAYA